MGNKKKIAAKSKTKTSKYAKLMKAASKELADKKNALAKAEKTLATASKNHAELLQETARLDMLERSLKALVDGTEPPTNVKYVYNYPQWVWTYPNQGWGTQVWQTPGTVSTPYYYGTIQNGQVTNAINTIHSSTSGALPNSTLTCTSGMGALGLDSNYASLTDASGSVSLTDSSLPSAFTLTTSGAGASSGQLEFTVDLSTGATEEDDKSVLSAEVILPFLDVNA
jgi:hypothetical protein